jgi:hypothetical protein
VVASGTGATLAAFSDTSMNSANTMTAKRIFPGMRATTGWTISDAADGSAADKSDPTVAVDAVRFDTSNWNNNYAATRYITFDFAGGRPAGLSTSSVALQMDIAADGGAATVCYYLEVYRTSTSTLIGTHGDAVTPAACVTGTTITSTTTSLDEVTDTDIANDLTVKIFAKESGKASMRIDRAAITGSTPYNSFSLFRTNTIDAADGSAATTAWSIATADATNFQNGGNWPATFAATRYVDVTFPSAHVPGGSTVSSFDFHIKFKAQQNAKALCLYYEVFSGATSLGTYGSSGSPYCSDTANNWRTDTISMPAVDTPGEVNGLRVRIYGQVSGGGPSLFDLIEIRPNYYLD